MDTLTMKYIYIIFGIIILIMSIPLIIEKINNKYYGLAIILTFIIFIMSQIGSIIDIINTIKNDKFYEKDLGIFFFSVGTFVIIFNIYKLYEK